MITSLVPYIASHLVEFEISVRLQGLASLVCGPPVALAFQQGSIVVAGRKFKRVSLDGLLEPHGVARQGSVGEPDPYGLGGADRKAPRCQRPSRQVAHPSRQDVCPILRTVKAHGAVVRVKHNAVTQHNPVGAQREHDPTSPGVACHRAHHELIGAHDDLLTHVVNGDDVGPCRRRRICRRLDHAQVDAVGERLTATQQQHSGVLGHGMPQRAPQASALGRRHRAVIEIEAHRAYHVVAVSS